MMASDGVTSAPNLQWFGLRNWLAQPHNGACMETVINFFTLRPTFTHLGLKIAWYLYLFNTAVQTYATVTAIFQVLAQRGVQVELWSPNFIPLLLGLIAQLVLVRLMIEVAAIIISASPI